MAEVKARKELRADQKFWLDTIMQRFEDNLTDMVERCNETAKKLNLKPISAATLRNFYYGYGDKEALLSERTVLLLYKTYDLEPTFSSEAWYDMEKDTAPISQYAKLCKQYISDVSRRLGIYRMDLAKNASIHPTTFSRLFNDKLSHGLIRENLEAVREYSRMNYPPKLRALLDRKSEAQEVPIIGYISLKVSDAVLLYDEHDTPYIPPPAGLDPKRTRAVELKGPTINPMVKDGMLLFFYEPEAGVGADCIEETCLVETEEGRLCVKLVERTNKKGMYRLHSLINGEIEEAPLKSAARLQLSCPK